MCFVCLCENGGGGDVESIEAGQIRCNAWASIVSVLNYEELYDEKEK